MHEIPKSIIASIAVVSLLTLAACSRGGAAESSAPDSRANDSAPAARSDGSGTEEVACRQVGVGNYMATFSSCSDDQVWALLCRERDHAWQCECKVGETVASNETLADEPYELTLNDPELLRRNAAAAANETCGFSITYKPRS